MLCSAFLGRAFFGKNARPKDKLAENGKVVEKKKGRLDALGEEQKNGGKQPQMSATEEPRRVRPYVWPSHVHRSRQEGNRGGK